MKGKNKLVPRLLGITKECVMRVDEKTKEVIQEWNLTNIKRWAASPKSFTLVRPRPSNPPAPFLLVLVPACPAPRPHHHTIKLWAGSQGQALSPFPGLMSLTQLCLAHPLPHLQPSLGHGKPSRAEHAWGVWSMLGAQSSCNPLLRLCRTLGTTRTGTTQCRRQRGSRSPS